MYNYQDHLFSSPLNEIGYPTAKAIHDKYVKPYITNSSNDSVPQNTIRASNIIGRLHDKVKFNPDKNNLSDRDRQRFNYIAGNANNIITKNLINQVESKYSNDPHGHYLATRALHTKYIKPLIAKTHIGLENKNYPNSTLSASKAIKHLINNSPYYSDDNISEKKKSGLHFMQRNANQIDLNQHFAQDLFREKKRNEKNGDDGVLNMYHYMQNGPKYQLRFRGNKFYMNRKSDGGGFNRD